MGTSPPSNSVSHEEKINQYILQQSTVRISRLRRGIRLIPLFPITAGLLMIIFVTLHPIKNGFVIPLISIGIAIVTIIIYLDTKLSLDAEAIIQTKYSSPSTTKST